ncbi:MAG: right-handed parallel beta-helix repeat-containing protein [Elusimicrobiota bacterium]
MTKTYPVLGHSMRFLLEPGDSALACPCPAGELRAGDVALLVRWAAGRPAGYVIHRVLLNALVGGRRLLLTKGDANFLPDLPPSAFQPVALITDAARAGRAWSARPGPAWPLAAAYSFAAAKLLSWSVRAGFILFAAAVSCLPRCFGAVLNAVYLFWEARLYPAALRRLAPAPRPPGPGAAAPEAGEVKSGRITADETWSGRVVAADYLTIERGAAVTVLPGTEIIFERREPWFFPVLRAGTDGRLRELDSASAKLLVYGSFTAAGRPGAPVTFKGGSFGGVHALGGGEVALENCVLENPAACAVSGRDSARLELRACEFRGGRLGAEVSGRASVSMLNCLVEASAGPGVRVLDEAAAAVSGGKITGCAGPGAEVSGRAFSGFSGTDIENCAAGVAAAGAARVYLKNCSLARNTGHGAEIAGAAFFSAGGAAFSRNAAGLAAEGKNTLRFEDCVFEDQAGPAAAFSGANLAAFAGCAFRRNAVGLETEGKNTLRLEDCVFESQSGPAAVFSGANLAVLAGCAFRRNAAGPEAGGNNTLRFQRCLFEGQAGRAGVLSGGRAEFEGCAFTGNTAGISFLEGCAGSALNCSFFGTAAPALQVYGRARVHAAGTAFDGGPSALQLDGGSASLSNVKITGTPFPGIVCGDWARLEAAEVSYEGRPWLKPAAPRAAGPKARPLFLFAAATARLPGFAALYRLYYLAAPPAARLLLGLPGVRALYLYRGMAAKGWVAGLSDMDLACALEPAGPREEYALYSKLRGRLRLLKSFFPFTGEVLLATAGELAAFFDRWGVKGAEFSAASRLLYGRPLELRPEPPAAGLADLTEAFYAYTLLMRHSRAEGLPRTFARRNCLKNLVDIKRYLAPPSPARPSRAAYARLLGLPLENYPAVSRGDAAYEAFRALHLAAGGAGGEIKLEQGPAAAGGWFNRTAFDAACRGLAAGCGLMPGVVLDSLYRVCLVLPDDAAADKEAFLRAWAALGRLRVSMPALGAPPLLLTQSSFALLCRLPYLNNPAFSLDLRAGGLPGGHSPADGGVYCWNLAYGGAAPGAGQLQAAAALAARHFRASWRSLWTEMPPHYFYTRALGLRLLLEQNTVLPFSEPERLRAAFAPGGDMPPWAAYCAGGAGEANYLFISAQAAKLGELADAR